MTSRALPTRISDLLDRLSRLAAAEEWNGPLNPSQNAALAYLGQANRFSRAPSHVADYLSTTRGTASQTLKALARKSLISEARLEHDKRSIRYDLTEAGRSFLASTPALGSAITALPDNHQQAICAGLDALLRETLKQRGGKSFGLCSSCAHHEAGPGGPFCKLLDLPLDRHEADQICHEHTPA